MLHRRKHRVLVILAVLITGALIAKDWTIPCSPCGNSTEGRGWETARLLDAFSGRPDVARQDTVTVEGGDGTNGKYLLTSKLASIRWTCIKDCGPGDEIDAFVPIYRDLVHEPSVNESWSSGLWSDFVSWFWGLFIGGGVVIVGDAAPVEK